MGKGEVGVSGKAGHLQLGELAVGEEAQATLHNVVLAHLHRAARQQLCHKQCWRQLLQIPTPQLIYLCDSGYVLFPVSWYRASRMACMMLSPAAPYQTSCSSSTCSPLQEPQVCFTPLQY